MKTPLALFCLLILISGEAQKPNLKEIQRTVFGKLPIGVKQSEYNKQFPKIVASSMSITKGTKYPYFQINNRGIIDYRSTFFFPHAFHNEDSIVTRIIFYLYQTKFHSEEVVNAATNSNQKENYIKEAEENQNKLDFLINEFDTRKKIDSTFLLFLPNIAQGNSYQAMDLEFDIKKFITQKYSTPSATNVVGNEYDYTDYSFYKEILWKSDKLSIRFVQRRFPVIASEPSDEFYYVLIYEFNDETKKKYGLKKQNDLLETF